MRADVHPVSKDCCVGEVNNYQSTRLGEVRERALVWARVLAYLRALGIISA